MKGEDTMSRAALSVRGKVKEIGARLLARNPYMIEIYPTEESRKALTVFCIYEGNGEWFDLSKKPIERASFTFGNAKKQQNGYYITDKCFGCESCLSVCPQGCIEKGALFVIKQENCLHCRNCITVCLAGAVGRRLMKE